MIIGLGEAGAFSGVFHIQCMDSVYEIRYETVWEGVILYTVKEIQGFEGQPEYEYVPAAERNKSNHALAALVPVGIATGGVGKHNGLTVSFFM